MKLCILLLLSLLLVFVHGMPPNTRCRCLQVESRIIPPDSLKSIKLYKEGAHCPDTEVIAQLVNGDKVCLDPRSSWVKKLLRFVLQKKVKQAAAAPKKTEKM
ncbi:interleukin-8-like [Antennarius striatus]|uniref:interleukin-8-like n=1 Tax=Antennarius striatus TaxID=241820 RepID=UPI0035AE0670